MQDYNGQQYRIRYEWSNTVRIKSILRELHVCVFYHSFSQKAAAAVNCESGIISFDKQGRPNLLEHDLEHRCRYLVQGNWPVDISDEKDEQSLLSSLLKSALFGDVDAPQKIYLVGEVDAAAALGISTRLIQPRALILYGQIAENGNSEILAQMREIWPTAAVATVSLQKFSDDKYLVQLAGKLLNASGKLASARTIGAKSFKQVVTGDPVTGRDIYRSAVQLRCIAQHVFATNHLPEFHGGMYRDVRRGVRDLNFKHSMPEQERIAGPGQRICHKESDFVLDFFVNCAARLTQKGAFSVPAGSAAVERE